MAENRLYLSPHTEGGRDLKVLAEVRYYFGRSACDTFGPRVAQKASASVFASINALSLSLALSARGVRGGSMMHSAAGADEDLLGSQPVLNY